MKKITIALFIFGIFVNISNAQDSPTEKHNHLKVETGFWVNIQGSIPFKDIEHTTLVPELLNVYSFNMDRWTLTPFLRFGLDNVGAGGFLTYEIFTERKISTYVSYSKELLGEESGCLIGLCKNVEGRGDIFIELSSSTHKWEPQINVGVVIPLVIPLKE